MKSLEDFTGLVDIGALREEETLFDLFERRGLSELGLIYRALRRRLGLSKKQTMLLIKLFNDTIDARGLWPGDEEFHDGAR